MPTIHERAVAFNRDVGPRRREFFSRLGTKQSPSTLFIACSDSRVIPETLASADPGELFVVRNVGNIVPRRGEGEPEEAAIGLAVQKLMVTGIIVCGHSDCAAMRALLSEGPGGIPGYLERWLKHSWDALEKIREGFRMKGEWAPHDDLSQINVICQLEHLESYPAVRNRVAEGRLSLHGWWFDIARSELRVLSEDRSEFALPDGA